MLVDHLLDLYALHMDSVESALGHICCLISANNMMTRHSASDCARYSTSVSTVCIEGASLPFTHQTSVSLLPAKTCAKKLKWHKTFVTFFALSFAHDFGLYSNVPSLLQKGGDKETPPDCKQQ